MSDDIKCSKCGKWSEVCHDDGAAYSEDERHTQNCDHCGTEIEFQTCITFDYWPWCERLDFLDWDDVELKE